MEYLFIDISTLARDQQSSTLMEGFALDGDEFIVLNGPTNRPLTKSRIKVTDGDTFSAASLYIGDRLCHGGKLLGIGDVHANNIFHGHFRPAAPSQIPDHSGYLRMEATCVTAHDPVLLDAVVNDVPEPHNRHKDVPEVYIKVKSPSFPDFQVLMEKAFHRCERAGLEIRWVSVPKHHLRMPCVEGWTPSFEPVFYHSWPAPHSLQPLLFCLALRAEAKPGEVIVVDHEGTLVSEKIKSNDPIFAGLGDDKFLHNQLERLGIVEKRINWAAIGAGGDLGGL